MRFGIDPRGRAASPRPGFREGRRPGRRAAQDFPSGKGADHPQGVARSRRLRESRARAPRGRPRGRPDPERRPGKGRAEAPRRRTEGICAAQRDFPSRIRRLRHEAPNFDQLRPQPVDKLEESERYAHNYPQDLVAPSPPSTSSGADILRPAPAFRAVHAFRLGFVKDFPGLSFPSGRGPRPQDRGERA